MAAVRWEPAGRHWCEQMKQETLLLEQRLYPDESPVDAEGQYRVLLRDCTLRIELQLGCDCPWSGKSLQRDSFAGAPHAACGFKPKAEATLFTPRR